MQPIRPGPTSSFDRRSVRYRDWRRLLQQLERGSPSRDMRSLSTRIRICPLARAFRFREGFDVGDDVGEFVRIRDRNGQAGMSTHEHPLENLTAQCSPRPLVRKLAEGRRQCAPANSIRIDRMTTRAISLSKSLTFDRVLRRRVPGKEDREKRGQKPDPDKAFQGRFPSSAMLQHSATLRAVH